MLVCLADTGMVRVPVQSQASDGQHHRTTTSSASPGSGLIKYNWVLNSSTMFHRSNNGEIPGLLASQSGIESHSMALQKLSENSSKVTDAAMTTADTLLWGPEWLAPVSSRKSVAKFADSE